MRIAVLECEQISAAPDPKPGDYSRLFKNLLETNTDAGRLELVPYSVYAGEIPVSVYEYQGYLVTGSYAGVYNDDQWIGPLLRFIRDAHEAGASLAGVCFGHQAIAQALGGHVEKADAGWGLGVKPTRIVRKLPWMVNGTTPDQVRLIYVHQDQVVYLPEGAETFARTENCPVAGFTLGETVLGLQGHPEFTPEVTEQIIRRHQERLPREDVAEALASLAVQTDRSVVAGWIARFFLASPGDQDNHE